MKRNIVCLVMCLSVSLLVGCGSLQEQKTVGFSQESIQGKAVFADSYNIKHKLYAQFDEWRGVRHKLGGLSRRGIDCSGFVHLTFKSKFGLHLPRTTRLQSKLGAEIRKVELKAGDLVFFKTGMTSRHVGMYLEKNNFLHVSSKKGVTISKLDNIYWKSNYWKSIRI
tara:strand:+ start:310 stop:810 length:501 start_codon:yes stop_codon:yes gene_type:complete